MIFFNHAASKTSKLPVQPYNTIVSAHYVHKGITIIQKFNDIHEHMLRAGGKNVCY